MRAVVIAVLALVALAVAVSATGDLSVETRKMLFDAWKLQHSKSYASQAEHDERFQVFSNNLEFIRKHNADKTKTFTVAMNHFGDLTTEEYRNTVLAKNRPPQVAAPRTHALSGVSIPESYDARTAGLVTTVKDQGQCGSCWTFSATASVESAWAKAGHELVSLSEQQIVDCDSNDGGCNGGLMDNAFQYLINAGGQEAYTAYTYTAVQGRCKFDASKVVARISSFTDVPANNDAALADAVYNHGTVSVAIDASQQSFQFYSGGVYQDTGCSSDPNSLDHGVAVVGYTPSYWIVKNSWSASWGNQGYIWFARGSGINQCGILDTPSYAVA